MYVGDPLLQVGNGRLDMLLRDLEDLGYGGFELVVRDLVLQKTPETGLVLVTREVGIRAILLRALEQGSDLVFVQLLAHTSADDREILIDACANIQQVLCGGLLEEATMHLLQMLSDSGDGALQFCVKVALCDILAQLLLHTLHLLLRSFELQVALKAEELLLHGINLRLEASSVTNTPLDVMHRVQKAGHLLLHLLLQAGHLGLQERDARIELLGELR
mmetsp:Transcript_40361/g.88255  ORF Transcript_40361/g.88255 Transcript_40361/m.88255 type:complete len:219 (+) Transcript_40361:128-784(+)